MTTPAITHRQRMLAAMRGEPTDRVPFAPRMDLWYIAQRARGALPPRFQEMNTVEMAEELDVACHAVGADFTLAGGRDVSLRGLGIDSHQDYPYRVELRDLPMESTDDGIDLRTRIRTSVGEVYTHLHRDEEMARAGISLPFVRSYAIESVDDFEAVGEIFEHLEVVPTPEAYASFHARIGERGVAVARGPVAASPVHLMLHELCAMDQFFYLYTDVRDEMYALAERMAPFFDACLEALVDCKAEVVFWGANYDQDLTWPPFFRREIMPWLQEAGERLHAAGKLLLTHTDGENGALLPLYPKAGFDVAESVCPAPMTNHTLAEIRAGMGPEITVWGGIPSVALLRDSMNDQEFDAFLTRTVEEMGDGRRLILGVSDNVPPDADLARLERIRDAVRA